MTQPGAVRRALAITLLASSAVASCGSDTSADPALSSPTAATAPASSEAPVTPAATTTTTTPDTTTLAASPDTTPATTAADTTAPETAPERECRRLDDFDTGDGWFVVNDGVMGGRSAGEVAFADSTMRFTGTVVTAGGGFTSVRLQLAGDELVGSDTIEMRVRADGRVYALTLQDDAASGRRSVSHGADLVIDAPADAASWQIASLPYSALSPTIFGQPIEAPPFNPEEANQFGIIISDGIDGDFALEVDWIDACAN